MNMVLIRELTIGDHEEVIKLWQSAQGVCNCDKCMFLDTKEQVGKYLERNPGLSFVAVENGILLGTILGGHDGRTGLIYRLTVLEEFRNCGIATSLVNEVVNALKAEGITNVKAFVLHDNEGANAFWERVGFNVLERAITRELAIDS
jgi:ribosomal protein S18 acetylase RimI-like enzyme